MFTSYDKAIAAFLTALISILALANLPVPAFLQDPTMIATIASMLAGIITYLVPNKKPAADSTGIGTSKMSGAP